jgi:hypothetical protein
MRADGRALTRRFHIPGAADAKWWHVVDGKPASELKRESGDALVIELPLEKPAP